VCHPRSRYYCGQELAQEYRAQHVAVAGAVWWVSVVMTRHPAHDAASAVGILRCPLTACGELVQLAPERRRNMASRTRPMMKKDVAVVPVS
jgi:hypothetical protein